MRGTAMETRRRERMEVACAGAGCKRTAAEDSRFCLRCADEIERLNEIAAGRDDRQAWAHALRRAGHRVRTWLWVPELIFVLGAIACIFWQFGKLLLDGSAQ